MALPKLLLHLTEGCRESWNESGMFFVEDMSDLEDEGFSHNDLDELEAFVSLHIETWDAIEIDPDRDAPDDALITCYAALPAITAEMDPAERDRLLECGNAECIQAAIEEIQATGAPELLAAMTASKNEDVLAALTKAGIRPDEENGVAKMDENELIAQITWTRKDLAEHIRQQGGDPDLAYSALSPETAAQLGRTLEVEAIRTCSFALENVAQDLMDAAPAPEPPALRKIEDLEEVLETHVLWLRGKPGGRIADFRHADLSGADLRDAQLGGALFTGADLTGADMRSANVSDADMQDAILDGADMTKAFAAETNFTDASMRGTKMDRMYMRDAILDGAVLKDVSMEACDLRGIRADATIFERVSIEHPVGDLGFLDQGFCNGVTHHTLEQPQRRSPGSPGLREAARAAKSASNKLASEAPARATRREER